LRAAHARLSLSYRWIDHTAELGLELEAPSRDGIFAEGFAAMTELLGAGAEPGGEAAHAEVALEGTDGAALLADWLAELALLAETEGLVPQALDSMEVSETALRATVRGRRAAVDHLVKAVTYHGLVLEPGWRASVVFDV
jgi:SHS2 domain-containing protein